MTFAHSAVVYLAVLADAQLRSTSTPDRLAAQTTRESYAVQRRWLRTDPDTFKIASVIYCKSRTRAVLSTLPAVRHHSAGGIHPLLGVTVPSDPESKGT